MKIRFLLIVICVICSLSIVFCQSEKTIELNDLAGGTVSGEYTTGGSSRSSNTGSSTWDQVHAEGTYARARAQYEQDVADENISQINSKYRGSGRNTLPSGFGRMTEEQQSAFDYFARLEMESGRNISVSGTNAVTRSLDASRKGAATGNTTTARSYQQAAADEMPGDVSGMTIGRNGSNKVREAILSSQIDQFKQLSPDEKQKEYNKTYSETGYHENRKKDINKNISELSNNYYAAMDYYRNKGLLNSQEKAEKAKIQQLANEKSKELDEDMKNALSGEAYWREKVRQMEENCTNCRKPQ